MSMYEPLGEFLKGRRGQETPMTFREIEQVIGSPLPASARKHRAWWSNNGSNNVMVKVWKAAGFQSERVDMGSEKLVFRRVVAATPTGMSETASPAFSGPAQAGAGSLFDRLYGAMRGTVTIAPGVDLTEPTGERWSAMED